MGAVAHAARAKGARVTGVIPRFISKLTSSDVDDLIVTEGMRDRKAKMEELSDAFVALAGGFGTLEETLEIITYAQLGLVSKPVALVNTLGFYDPLAEMFDKLFRERFAKPVFRSLYRVTEDPLGALEFVAGWKPLALERKWF